jgi:transposase
VCLNGIKGSKAAQKTKMQKSRVKTMFTAFFDAKGIIHHEFVLEKQTVNGKFCKEVIKRLITRVHCVRTEFQEIGSWYLLHDNVWVHSSGIVSDFLVKRGIPMLSHPPYSLDLFPADFLFPKLKIVKKCTRFQALSSIKQIVVRELKAICGEAFSWAFDSLYARYKHKRAGSILSDGINKYFL